MSSTGSIYPHNLLWHLWQHQYTSASSHARLLIQYDHKLWPWANSLHDFMLQSFCKKLTTSSPNSEQEKSSGADLQPILFWQPTTEIYFRTSLFGSFKLSKLFSSWINFHAKLWIKHHVFLSNEWFRWTLKLRDLWPSGIHPSFSPEVLYLQSDGDDTTCPLKLMDGIQLLT